MSGGERYFRNTQPPCEARWRKSFHIRVSEKYRLAISLPVIIVQQLNPVQLSPYGNCLLFVRDLTRIARNDSR